MRVNSRVFAERMDMTGFIQIPNCPSEFREQAEKIMTMLTKLGFIFPDYHNIKQLDKMLMLAYWKEYDDLTQSENFDEWFVSKATAPEWIRRARQWLVQGNYLILKPEVQRNAYEAGSKVSKSMRH